MKENGYQLNQPEIHEVEREAISVEERVMRFKGLLVSGSCSSKLCSAELQVSKR